MVTKRARLWLRRGATLAATLVVLALGTSTWLYASRIEERLLDVPHAGPSFDFVVQSVTPRTVRLPRTSETVLPGVWGLDFQGGFAEVGGVLDVSERSVLRTLKGVYGLPRNRAVVDFVPQIGRDPSDRGVVFDEVLIEGPLGAYPAWEIPGDDDTWVVMVHDRGDGRRQALAIMPAVAAAGFPILVPTYRNHDGAPETEHRRFSLGETERRDLEAALGHAFRQGARDVVLVAFGSGSAVVAELLHASPWADVVRAVVLDSPLLDPGAAVDADASSRNVPGFVIGWAKALGTLRFGIDWSSSDQVQRAEEWNTPVLVIHGRDDAVAPIASSADFAALRPDLVTLHSVPMAGHTATWNVDPAGYEAVLVGFVTEHAGGPSPLDPVDPEDVARRAARS